MLETGGRVKHEADERHFGRSGSRGATGVPLREGNNILTATATGVAGNVGTGSVTVILDTTPPTVRINSPADEAVVTSAAVTVTGIINDAVSGTVNGKQASVTVNGVPLSYILGQAATLSRGCPYPL